MDRGPLSQVKSDSEGHGSSPTMLCETSVDKLFSGEPKYVNSRGGQRQPAHPELRRPEVRRVANRRELVYLQNVLEG